MLSDDDGGAGAEDGVSNPVDRPCAASAFTTASHPASSVLIRSLSSSFSRSRSETPGKARLYETMQSNRNIPEF